MAGGKKQGVKRKPLKPGTRKILKGGRNIAITAIILKLLLNRYNIERARLNALKAGGGGTVAMQRTERQLAEMHKDFERKKEHIRKMKAGEISPDEHNFAKTLAKWWLLKEFGIHGIPRDHPLYSGKAEESYAEKAYRASRKKYKKGLPKGSRTAPPFQNIAAVEIKHLTTPERHAQQKKPIKRKRKSPTQLS